jgi:hypothetical protein
MLWDKGTKKYVEDPSFKGQRPAQRNKNLCVHGYIFCGRCLVVAPIANCECDVLLAIAEKWNAGAGRKGLPERLSTFLGRDALCKEPPVINLGGHLFVCKGVETPAI